MFSLVPLYPWCVCSIMAQSRDGLALSFSSACLLLVCWERRGERESEEGGRRREECWGLDPVPAHPIKGIFCARHSLATCVLTFVFLSVVIYGTMELKAKLAAAQHQRPHSDVGWAWIDREDQAARVWLSPFISFNLIGTGSPCGCRVFSSILLATFCCLDLVTYPLHTVNPINEWRQEETLLHMIHCTSRPHQVHSPDKLLPQTHTHTQHGRRATLIDADDLMSESPVEIKTKIIILSRARRQETEWHVQSRQMRRKPGSDSWKNRFGASEKNHHHLYIYIFFSIFNANLSW